MLGGSRRLSSFSSSLIQVCLSRRVVCAQSLPLLAAANLAKIISRKLLWLMIFQAAFNVFLFFSLLLRLIFCFLGVIKGHITPSTFLPQSCESPRKFINVQPFRCNINFLVCQSCAIKESSLSGVADIVHGNPVV